MGYRVAKAGAYYEEGSISAKVGIGAGAGISARVGIRASSGKDVFRPS
jgi:NAD-dependent SIR2 family protein deacetylase